MAARAEFQETAYSQNIEDKKLKALEQSLSRLLKDFYEYEASKEALPKTS